MGQYISQSFAKITDSSKESSALSWSPFNASTAPLFRAHGLLRLTEYNIYHNACMMYQVVYGLNNRLCDLVPICCPLHTHDTRRKHLVYGKKRKLKRTSLSIVCRGPQIWNDLDENIKMSKSLSIFKKNLKKHLLSTYDD